MLSSWMWEGMEILSFEMLDGTSSGSVSCWFLVPYGFPSSLVFPGIRQQFIQFLFSRGLKIGLWGEVPTSETQKSSLAPPAAFVDLSPGWCEPSRIFRHRRSCRSPPARPHPAGPCYSRWNLNLSPMCWANHQSSSAGCLSPVKARVFKGNRRLSNVRCVECRR